ncbi:MAG: SUMF1/EgtB/PvdO family nonheme iron enzyme [Magnetococcales bacterium]|nr:SUMF1/EgtB/PvdO family nonheme iron enzyme [Magnetococcales bacterium]
MSNDDYIEIPFNATGYLFGASFKGKRRFDGPTNTNSVKVLIDTFWIMAYPLTYRQCMDNLPETYKKFRNVKDMSNTEKDKPIYGLTFQEATNLATAMNGRLPTEAEWELAATKKPIPKIHSLEWCLDIWHPKIFIELKDGCKNPLVANDDSINTPFNNDKKDNIPNSPHTEFHIITPPVHCLGKRVVKGWSEESPEHQRQISFRRALHENMRHDHVGLRLVFTSSDREQP